MGLIEWLAAEICPVVLNDDGVRAALLARCRKLGIEPPGRLERILGGTRSRFDKGFCAEVVDRLSAESIDRLEELVTGRDGFLVELKSDPGPLGLDTLWKRSSSWVGEGDRATGGFVVGVFGEAGGGVAGPRGSLLPIGLAGQPPCGPVDVAGGIVLVADQ